MLSSVASEGVRGLQSAQREMLKSANEISRVTVATDPGLAAQSTSIPGETSFAPVTESVEARSAQDNLSEPLIELRRQEQLFDASARVISVADQNIGSLLDVTT